MTARNRDRRALSPETNEFLAQLWRQLDIDAREVSRARLRATAQHVSVDAYETGLFPEDVIIAVRESWNTREGRRPTREPQRTQAAIAELISFCIVEFYILVTTSSPSPTRASSLSFDRRAFADRRLQ